MSGPAPGIEPSVQQLKRQFCSEDAVHVCLQSRVQPVHLVKVDQRQAAADSRPSDKANRGRL